jgi:hypothetical protein
MAIFFSAATAAGAFGGLLARAIMLMEGISGLGAWQCESILIRLWITYPNVLT